MTERDIAQISFGYGMFTGGFGLHYGLERAGATVVPVSSGNTDRQLMFMVDFQTTVLISTPSYAAHLVRAGEGPRLEAGRGYPPEVGLVRRRTVDGRHAPAHPGGTGRLPRPTITA